VSELVG